ncbi:MAG: MarR family transcriptional regulator [Desulfovibrio sp.]|jgi:DNA-binding MarR family transcriptional regulator|nr:MarR family transcriptional regulator [Desulfovibrio sp.]
MFATTSHYLLKDSLGHLATQFSKAALRRINQELAAQGHPVTSEQWTALVHIWNQEGLTQQELGEKLLKDKTNIARLAAGLERLGYIRRDTGSRDRRERSLRLTESGRDMMPRLAALVQGVLHEACAGIDEHSLYICRQVLRKARQNLAPSSAE